MNTQLVCLLQRSSFWRSGFLSFCSQGHSSHPLWPWNLPWQDIDRFLLRFGHLIPEINCFWHITSSRLLRAVLFILNMAPLIENQKSTKQPIALARLASKSPPCAESYWTLYAVVSPFHLLSLSPHFCSSVHLQSQGSYCGQVSVSDAHLTLKSNALGESADSSLLLSALFQVISGFLLNAFFYSPK